MAKSTDPRASQFSAAKFREAVKFAMKMGLPEDTSERATFQWETVKTYTVTDSSGNPWKHDSPTNSVVTHADVKVDVAVEFIPRTTQASGNAIGDFDSPRAIITILDSDFPSVSGADKVLLGGNTYKIDFVAPSIGLFDVTVYQIYCSALDES